MRLLTVPAIPPTGSREFKCCPQKNAWAVMSLAVSDKVLEADCMESMNLALTNDRGD